jgi:hypothetical protein
MMPEPSTEFNLTTMMPEPSIEFHLTTMMPEPSTEFHLVITDRNFGFTHLILKM